MSSPTPDDTSPDPADWSAEHREWVEMAAGNLPALPFDPMWLDQRIYELRQNWQPPRLLTVLAGVALALLPRWRPPCLTKRWSRPTSSSKPTEP